MPAIETTIKNTIKAKLDALVPATLGEVQVDDFKISSIFDRDIAKYPAAVLVGAAIEEANALTNRDNERIYTFEILVIEKGENVTSATQIEELRETLLNTFDNDPTLGLADVLGNDPAFSPAETITDRSRSYVVFSVVLKVRSAYTRP